MKKIGILTFNNCANFGAIIQNFALNKFLTFQNQFILTINYLHLSSNIYYLYILMPLKQNSKILKIVKWLYNIVCYFRFSKIIKGNIFKKFIKNNIPSTKICKDIKNINKYNFDTIIIGSDQVWNNDLTGGIDKIYWGQELNSKIISYAASIGKEKYIDKDEKILIEYSKVFSAISVRETDSANYLSKLFNRDVYTVCDPVFLLEKKDYEELIFQSKIKIDKKFIFIYNLNNSEYLYKIANNLNENNKYKIYSVDRSTKMNGKQFIGPAEFLYLINNADYILTDSFHCISLSIIMEKEFYTYISPFGASRLHNILEKSGLTNREINEHKEIDLKKIDYKKVKEHLAPFIEYSKNYLKENI